MLYCWLEIFEDKLVGLNEVEVRIQVSLHVFFFDLFEVVIPELGNVHIGTWLNQREARVVGRGAVLCIEILLDHLALNYLVLRRDCDIWGHFAYSVKVRIKRSPPVATW